VATSTVSGQVNYSAPLTPTGPDDGWVIDAVNQPPEVLFNFRMVTAEVPITDLRDGGMQPRLDDAGFEMIVSPTRVDQQALLDGSASALEQYQQEMKVLLESHTGADAVLFFDTTLRREDTDCPRNPFYQSAHTRVHIDQSPRSARARARARAANCGGPERRFRRFQIINVWRPLIEHVRNFPLALCDYRSVDLAADLVVTHLKFGAWLKDRENYSVKYSSSHRWYFWEALSPDEVTVFKCYDSASHGLALIDADAEPSGLIDVSGLCPHTAFFNQNGPATGRLRTSIEMRALVFYG
jgi:cephamycin C biosynthesis protein